MKGYSLCKLGQYILTGKVLASTRILSTKCIYLKNMEAEATIKSGDINDSHKKSMISKNTLFFVLFVCLSIPSVEHGTVHG